jgi:hypothetical protein
VKKFLKSNFAYICVSAILYLLCSLLIFSDILRIGISNSILKKSGGDLGLSTFNVAWLPFALSHGLNIFYSNYEYALHGINLMGTPAYFLQSFVLMPITIEFGPTVSINVGIILGPAITAFSAMVVYFKITQLRIESFLAGLILGYSALVLNDSTFGHLHMTWLFGPPIIFYIYYKILKQSDVSILKTGLILGLVFTLQFYASVEILTDTLFFGFILGLIFLLLNRSFIRQKIVPLVLVTAIGGFTSLLFCGYAIYYFFYGKDHVFYNNGLNANPVFKLSLADVLLPIGKHDLSVNLFSNKFAVIVIPAVVIILVILKLPTLLKNHQARISLLFSLIIYFCMIGPYLRIISRQDLVPNPVYDLLSKLPIISATLFARFSYYFLFVFNFAFIIAFASVKSSFIEKRHLLKVLSSFKTWIVVLLVLNMLWIDSNVFNNQKNLTGDKVLSTQNYIPHNAVVWIYPRISIYNGLPLIYLAQSNFGYKVTSGYGFVSVNNTPTFYLETSPIDSYIFLETFNKQLVKPSTKTVNMIKQYVIESKISCLVVYDVISYQKVVAALSYIFNKPHLVENNALWCHIDR